MNKEDVLGQIRDVFKSPANRQAKAESIAGIIRSGGNYRWVSIYKVDEAEIAALAWSGAAAPAYPSFAVTQGLSAHAVSSRSTVISNDVANDPRYLTAFGSTQSEIIVPVFDSERQRVIGTLDVESERRGAFTAEDRESLEECARALFPLWQ